MSDSKAVPQPVPVSSSAAHSAANDLRDAATGDYETRSIRGKAADLKASTAAKLDEFRDFAGEKAAAVKEITDGKIASAKVTASEKGELLRAKAADSAEAFRVSADEQWKVARARADEARVEIEQRIREKPLKAVLIAAAVGYVLGRSLRS